MSKQHKKNKVGQIISWIILLALCVFVFYFFILPSFYANNKKYGTYKTEGLKQTTSWMKDVSDSTELNEINIPGTHDSCTQYVALKYFSKCQTKPVSTQLEMGYRYLDIRLAIDDDDASKLKLMHGFCNCKTGNGIAAKTLYLDEVLQQCYSFLEENPSETILFAVKFEHGDQTIEEFQNVLDTYIAANSDKWFTKNYIPSMKECRGKIVLMRRYINESNSMYDGLNLLWLDQGNHEVIPESSEANPQQNGINVVVQDRFKYDTMDKWTTFVDALEKSNEKAADTVYINFLSTNGNTSYGHPVKYAVPLNKQFWNYNLISNTNYGWICVDYATTELAQKIYMSNF